MSVQEIIDLLYMMAGEEIIGLREKTEDGFILRLSEDMQFEITVKAAWLMQMFSFANRGVYGDAVHAPFSWRFRMKNPPVLPGEDKKLLEQISIIKK